MVTVAIKTSIIERVKTATVKTDSEITDSTELFEDLKIWGDDLYELTAWINKQFGTDFSKMKLSKYAPDEPWGELGLVRLFTGRSPYRRCNVAQLLDAVERGRWED